MKFALKKIVISLVGIAAISIGGCGGGGNSGATLPVTSAPSAIDPVTSVPGTPLVAGTVTGFGSVIVDGLRIDDKNVTAQILKEDGSTQLTELKIGHHVEVKHDGNLVATLVRVRPDIEGPVTAVNVAAGTFTVLGQTVTVNTDPALGPVSVFGSPATQLSDIAVNDKVEIHGMSKVDATAKPTLQATRIEKVALATFYRVKGVVQSVNTVDSTFKLGDLLVSFSKAAIKPNAAALVNDAEVNVSIPLPATLTGSATNVTAIEVSDKKVETANVEVNLGGALSKPDAATKKFYLGSVLVNAASASLEPTGKSFADLKDGTYVRVLGTYQKDGSLTAKMVVLPNANADAQVELHGSILSFVSNANFMLRDLNIDGSAAVVTCNGVALGNNLQVAVKGVLAATGKVTAKTIACENQVADVSLIERKGVVTAIDNSAKTMTVGAGNEAIAVVWTSSTLFIGLEGSTIMGKTVVINGTISDITSVTKRVFRATKIKLAQ